jgi:[lysine-biosynthesis-protein LysW]---L-2-aminoadipate ligase
MAIYLLAGQPSRTNMALVDAWQQLGVDAMLLRPAEARWRVQATDTVLARLDVVASLDGVEPGLRELRRLERRGVRVFNSPSALRAMHDKLETAQVLSRHGVPNPATKHVTDDDPSRGIELPVVVKPRFGSWGRDVIRCEDEAEYELCMEDLRTRPWFRRQGAIVQELIEPLGRDLRIIVARGEVVGAIERVAAPGDWRTNVALGAVRQQVTPPPEAMAAALAAAGAIGGDFIGVDLLPLPGGGYVVLELNGAVDFTSAYSLDGHDVFDRVAMILAQEETPVLAEIPLLAAADGVAGSPPPLGIGQGAEIEDVG